MHYFVGSLATKCVSKNDEKCMNRPTLRPTQILLSLIIILS